LSVVTCESLYAWVIVAQVDVEFIKHT